MKITEMVNVKYYFCKFEKCKYKFRVQLLFTSRLKKLYYLFNLPLWLLFAFRNLFYSFMESEDEVLALYEIERDVRLPWKFFTRFKEKRSAGSKPSGERFSLVNICRRLQR